MGIGELKPVAKSTLLGTVMGGVTGFLLGGPGGAVAGANFCGSVGAQIGMYNKGEDLANRAVESAGRKFEEISERTGRRIGRSADRVGRAVEKGVNRFADKLIVSTEKVVNLYSKTAIAGYIGSYTLEFSRYSGQTAKDVCISETEWLQCYLLRGAMGIFLLSTVITTVLLLKDLKKLRDEGLFNAPNTTVLPSIRNAYRTTTSESQKETCTKRPSFTQTTADTTPA